MEELNALLLASIRRHGDILSMFEAINGARGDKDVATLHTRGTEILLVQEQAALADQGLLSILQEMGPALSAHPLLDQRQAIMHQILEHTRSLLSTINTIKSLLAHEIKEMQGGRAALNGYRQTPPSQNGGILNDCR